MLNNKQKFGALIGLGILCYLLLTFNQSEIVFQDEGNYSFVENILENKIVTNWENEMIQRRMLAEKICRKYSNLSKIPTNEKILRYEIKSHLKFCQNSKAGSSSWEIILSQILNATTDFQNHRDLVNFRKPKNFNGQNTIFFTVVRHPFTRLVSAYKDKMCKKFGGNLRGKIISKYRNNGNDTTYFDKWNEIMDLLDFNILTTPTFVEFVSYVVDEMEWCLPNTTCHRNSINGHWWPYYERCNPCTLKFNVTAKTETFQKDFQYIKMKSLKLVVQEIWREKIAMKNVEWDNKPMEEITNNKINLSVILNDSKFKFLKNSFQYRHINKSKGKISTDKLTRKLWVLLSNDLKKRLRNIYKYDFELFNYDPYQFGQ